jgi:hypothetical protein
MPIRIRPWPFAIYYAMRADELGCMILAAAVI